MLEITQSQIKEYQAQFYPELNNRGIATSNGRIPVSVSPYLISLKQYQHLQYLCEQIHSAIEILLRCYANCREIQARFPELEHYRFLSLLQPPYKTWVHLARFDIIVSSEGKFRLIETNCDCPGGIIWYPLMKEVYKEMSLFKQSIQPLYPVEQPIDNPEFFIRSLIQIYQQTKKSTQIPTIAFLTSQYRPILTDMNSLSKVLQRMEIKGGHISVQDLEIHNGRVAWNDQEIDIVYQKFDAYIDDNDQMKPCIFENFPSEVAAYWQGLNDNLFMTFNSFPSAMVAENKRILALLQDPDLQVFFTEEQIIAIEELCAKTYTLSSDTSSSKSYHSILTHKDDYVLKRTIDTQGRGVILGLQCTQEEWKIYLEQAINRPYVVQEYIAQQKELIYVETLEKASVYGDLTMFMIAGKASGLISRSSGDIISNVSRTGNFRPVYVIPGDPNNVKL